MFDFKYKNSQIRVQVGYGWTRMVKILMMLTVGIFLLQSLIPNFINNLFGFIPSYAIGRFMLWQFMTAIFLHSTFIHLIFNMFGLYIFGGALEKLWGSKRFLKYYILCGVGGTVLTYLMYIVNLTPNAIYIGASGSIYGLLVAYSILYANQPVLLFFVIPMKAKYLAIIFGAIEFISLFQKDGIAHFGHLGGLFSGLLFLMLKRRLEKKY